MAKLKWCVVQVRGYGLSGDAHHMTQPDEGGRGARRAMSQALRQAGVPRSMVAYVNAHATSTPLGDAIEAAAIASIFSQVASSFAAFSRALRNS